MSIDIPSSTVVYNFIFFSTGGVAEFGDNAGDSVPVYTS